MPAWPGGPTWSWVAGTTVFVHLPITLVVSQCNQVAPDGDLWLSVLESTAQPISMR
jgi:hypothetical protein